MIAIAFSAVQAATPNIIGIDGYYHVKVAGLMWQQGWRLLFPLDFPWLQLTILGPGHYTDHHFLFHALQAPFTMGDMRVGAKMAAVLFATLGLYTGYLFLARHGVRYPLLWVAVLIAAAPTFIWRQSMARPQALFLALLIGAIWATIDERPRLLVPLGVLAVWLFDGFPFLLGVPVAAVAAHLLCRIGETVGLEHTGSRANLRPAVAALGWATLGLAAGLLLHPYVPRNLEFAYLHLLPKAVPTEQLDVPVGLEWNAFSPRGFVLRAGPSAALVGLGAVPPLLALARRRGPDWRTVMLGGLAIVFMVMAARSQRLIEYFPAFAMLFCAWSWAHPASTGVADLRRLASAVRERIAARWGGRPIPLGARWASRPTPLLARWGGRPIPLVSRWARWQIPLGARPDSGPGVCAASGRVRGSRPAALLASWWPWLAAAVIAPVLVTSIELAGRDARNGLAWDTYRDAARWLAANTPAGARVFTTDWDDFPYMFYWDTHNTYLVGLDPTYMSIYDPALYRSWRDVVSGRTAAPARTIREVFASRYVVTDLKHEGFLREAAADPGLEEAFRTKAVVVFRVRDAQG